MTHFNSKEEAFKDLLGELDFDLDTNAIWESVEDKLPRKNDEPKLPFFIWGIGLLILGLLGATMFYTPDTVETDAIYTEAELAGALPSTKALEQAIDKVALDIDTRKLISNVKSSVVMSPRTNQNQASSNINTVNEHQLILSTTSAQKPSNLNLSNAILYPKITSSTSANFNDKANAKMNSLVEAVSSLKPIYVPLAISYNTAPAKMSLSTVVIEPILLSAKNKWSPYYQLSTGPSTTLSKFSNTEQAINLSYESDLVGISSQFIYGLDNDDWNVFAGLKHSLNASRFSNHDLGSDTQDIPVASQYISGSGETETRAGFVSETTVTQNAIDWHRVHHNVDLQLGIGKSLFEVKRFSLSAELAATYNIWSKASGYYYSDNFTQITKFKYKDPNPYNNSNGFGAQFSINIEHKIGANTSIVLKPFYGKYFSPITNETLSYKIENSQIGLQMGISYRPTGSN